MIVGLLILGVFLVGIVAMFYDLDDAIEQAQRDEEVSS